MNHLSLRCVLLGIVSLLFAPTFAQGLLMELSITGGPDAMTEHVRKSVHEVVAGVDPDGRVSMDAGRVKLKVSSAISRADMLALLNGIDGVQFQVVEPPVDRQHPWVVYTTDGVVDEAATNAAKEQWVREHPEATGPPPGVIPEE
jgi:hypothetical protein